MKTLVNVVEIIMYVIAEIVTYEKSIIIKCMKIYTKMMGGDEPVDWNKNIVSGKKYDTTDGVGKDLLEIVSNILETQVNQTDIIKELEAELETLGIEGDERRAYIKVRVNQSVFREKLLYKYKNCCLCKVEHTELLRASHIKPWSDSFPREKIDVDNGLLLCPNHDALFDGGFISFNDNGEILLSDRLTQLDRTFMNVAPNIKIRLTDGNKVYMDYHRKNIFK